MEFNITDSAVTEKLRQQKIYDDLGAHYAGDQYTDKFSRIDINYIKECKSYYLFDSLGFREGDQVLDIGCNDGTLLNRLRHEYETKGWGVDISPRSIEFANSKNIYMHTFEVGDAENLTNPNDFFDFVVSFDLLEHVPSPHAVVSEAYRVLKPGGKALFYAVSKRNKYSFHGFLRFISNRKWGVDTVGGHKAEMFVDPFAIIEFSRSKGFKLEKMVYFHAFFTLIYDEKISPFVARVLLFLETRFKLGFLRKLYVKFFMPVILVILEILDLPWSLNGYSNGFYLIVKKSAHQPTNH